MKLFKVMENTNLLLVFFSLSLYNLNVFFYCFSPKFVSNIDLKDVKKTSFL